MKVKNFYLYDILEVDSDTFLKVGTFIEPSGLTKASDLEDCLVELLTSS